MRWTGRRESEQVEDRRGFGTGFPGGRGGLAVGGCGTIVLVFVVSLLTGADPLQLLQQIGGAGPVAVDTQPSNLPEDGTTATAGEDEQTKFVRTILADTEDTWDEIFAKDGRSYVHPKVVLFSGGVRSACGTTSAAVGPFYCPVDQSVYIDLAFYRDLDRRFGAPGDFAQAYVLAHEVGHHVQNLLGISEQVQRAQESARSEEEANAYSVRLELQADCLAGVWGHYANARSKMLEPGDVEEGLGAAAAIGDDRLQKMAQGYSSPESWTHGSSQMRVQWLRKGLESGDPDACDTFGGRS
ncbi:MAG: neutral zinc metallopeptidase [Thermoanaerobaculia bacterium]